MRIFHLLNDWPIKINYNSQEKTDDKQQLRCITVIIERRINKNVQKLTLIFCCWKPGQWIIWIRLMEYEITSVGRKFERWVQGVDIKTKKYYYSSVLWALIRRPGIINEQKYFDVSLESIAYDIYNQIIIKEEIDIG